MFFTRSANADCTVCLENQWLSEYPKVPQRSGRTITENHLRPKPLNHTVSKLTTSSDEDHYLLPQLLTIIKTEPPAAYDVLEPLPESDEVVIEPPLTPDIEHI